jgi:Zn-dependent protease/predicted transcriptional regulator
MRWVWKLGTFFGIDVYVHATFVLLLAWVVVGYWAQGHEWSTVLSGVGFTLALFACILLHELGHALTAQRMGIHTQDITLLPIGGIARLERMPDDPKQELWVALAGPAVNVVIAAVLLVGMGLTTYAAPLNRLTVASGPLLERLLVANVFLVLFNMLPAFPMDGGRVLRALLALRMDYVQATQVAATLGQGMALLFAVLGFVWNPVLLFIAFFVWIGATQEASLVQMRFALGGIPVSRAMVTDFKTLARADTLDRAVGLILSGLQQDFPVTDDGRVVGVLTRGTLLAALGRGREHETAVGDVMEHDFQLVEASEMLAAALQRLQTCACHILPVVHRGRLVGLLTMDNVGEFVMIQTALSRRDLRPGSAG